MTGGSLGLGRNQQGIAIAIRADAANLEEAAGGFAMGPQAALASAPKGDATGGFGGGQGLAIHIAEHQHGAAIGVLNDGWNQAVHFFPFERWQLQGRTSMPRARSSRRRFGIAISPE